MKDQITPVAIYGAGAVAISLYHYLNKKYKIICFCDRDQRKQGGRLFGIPVHDFNKVKDDYPELKVFIATNNDYKFEIMDGLINDGFPKERIINYEPYKKYKSCRCLETRMGFSEKAMVICPSNFGKHFTPIIPYTGDPKKNVQAFIKVRDSMIDTVSSIEVSGHKTVTCTGCPDLREKFWAINRRVEDISFCIKTNCNFHCFYCVENRIDKTTLIGNEHLEESIETMRLMKEKGVIAKTAIVSVAATELSAHPFRDQILEGMEGYICQFTTNASLYIDKIKTSLRNGGKVFCSLDAGTAETFCKVKGVKEKMFWRVCENLKSYAAAGAVEMKYIFLPGYNDNEADVDGFLTFCSEIQAAAIHIARNTFDYGKTMPEQTMYMISRMIGKANQWGLQVNFSPRLFLPEEYEHIQMLAANQKA